MKKAKYRFQSYKAQYGYCAVTADFLHIGHINLFKFCKSKCKVLIVGVMTDKAVMEYKGHKPIMTLAQRKEIIRSIDLVDLVFEQDTFEFEHQVALWKSFHGKDFIVFDSVEHKRKGHDYLVERTEGISSSLFRRIVSENPDYRKLQI